MVGPANLSPPSVATVRSAYETMWARAINRDFWFGAVRSGDIARIGMYAMETYGIFKMLPSAHTIHTNALPAMAISSPRIPHVVLSSFGVDTIPPDYHTLLSTTREVLMVPVTLTLMPMRMNEEEDEEDGNGVDLTGVTGLGVVVLGVGVGVGDWIGLSD
ncbi:hypothetical protein D9758_015058 [Tetrapyrgos nigripes]|uniref:Uncharacterized protein n=1 Tax=Tetrapyrgos nigripes TaxID=182062 RepID=A0A8H5FSI6_9AGAR|nr:hypothetical protein D9758_016803 [Tetrapyrgos nigripes]KAF5347474.1 hypothetical protein D9758_015058 [Tetrapyrgos nigripes]